MAEIGPAVRRWLGEQRQAWTANLRLLGTLRGAGLPGGAFAVLTVVSSLYGAVRAAVIGVVIARVGSLGANASFESLVGPLALFGGILLFEQLTGAASEAVGQVVARRVEGNVRREVRAALAGCVEIGVLEEPSTQNDISLNTAGSGGVTMSGALFAVSGAASSALALLAAGAIVAQLHPLLAAAYAAALLAGKSVVRSKTLELLDVHRGQLPLLRRRAYLATLHREAAKESRVYGLSGYLLDRHDSDHREAYGVVLPAYWKRERVHLASVAVAAALLAAIVWFAVAEALAGVISIGRATTYLLAAESMLMTLSSTSAPSAQASAMFAALDRLHDVLRPPVADTPPVPAPLRRDADGTELVRLESVTFRYPDSETPVLDQIDLTIRAGESLAIVGINGAGKTSLIKLIAGLYQPSSGRILVRGQPLTPDRVVAWRAELGAVFQDFVHYPLSARTNVTLAAGEAPGDAGALTDSLDASGAASVLGTLPAGIDSILSKQFTGGVELSGGQWQRIALARCLYAAARGASLLLLDEPTANLDVRAEFEAFDRLLSHTHGVATIIVSHRFSTVRKADRIVVVDHGRVVQDGNHASLMRDHGLYRQMFTTQASRFGDPVDATSAERPADA